MSGFFHLQASDIDSLILNTSSYKTVTGLSGYKTRLSIGIEYKVKEDFNTALKILSEGLEIAKKNKAGALLVDFHFHIGEAHLKLSHYDQSLEHFTEVIELSNRYVGKQPAFTGKAYGFIAKIYQSLGDYSQAYFYQTQALAQHESNDDMTGVTGSLYEIGTIYFYQNNLEKALEHYEEARMKSKEINNPRVSYACLAAIGSTYNRLGKFEEALKYNLKSKELAEEIDYQTGIGYALQNIGSDYLRLGNTKMAIEFFHQAYSIRQDLNDQWGMCGLLRSLTEAYLDYGYADQALIYGEELLELSKRIKSKPRQLEAFKILSEVYEELGEEQKALQHLKSLLVLKDSVLNESSIEKMSKVKKSYEVQKREKEIALMKKDQQIGRLQKNMIIAAFIIALLFIWVIYNRYRIQYANNRLLEEKNELINQQNQELEIAHEKQVGTNKLLQNSNKELEEFAYIASHDLKEPLRTIEAYVKLIEKNYFDALKETGASELMYYVTDGVQRMQTLLDDLLNYSRASRGQERNEPVNTKDVVDMILWNLQTLINEKNARVEVGNLPVLESSRTQLNQLFQNLIGNAVKYNDKESPYVKVDCELKNGIHVFSIQDNGIGIDQQHLKAVFQMFRRLHTRGEYEGTGIGLATCKKIVERLGGDIWVESTKNEGSIFYFSVPVKKELVESKRTEVAEKLLSNLQN